MGKMKSTGKWLSVLLVLVLAACSGNNPSSPENDNVPELPDLNKLRINVPQGAPPQVQGIALAVNSFISMGYGWLGPAYGKSPTGSDGTYEWKVTDRTLTITVRAVVQSDGSAKWTVTLNGTDPTTGETFNNWVAVSGSTDAKSKTGQFTIYEPNTTNVAAQINWTEDDKGNLNITMSTSEGQTWRVTSKADGSGSLVVEENGKKTFEASWTSDGSGTWASYNPDTGEQIGSGSWSS